MALWHLLLLALRGGDGVFASINVGNCFVIPFSELSAVSCAEWMEIALAPFGGDVEIS